MSSAAEHADVTHAPKINGLGDLGKLSLAALGVVYGDIGTSPLYAMKECFTKPHGVDVTPGNVFGIVSLVFWSLTLVIVVKYMSVVMRADNQGEGGILALLAKLKPKGGEIQTRKITVYVMLGLFGAALLYGDGVITPAMSVLSAVEGLGVATDFFTTEKIVVITVAILVLLFMAQKRGTARVGLVFGPAMLVWFATIAIMGVQWIAKRPEILWALHPKYAVLFFVHHRGHGFLVLGAVVLCITGGEALYADMGHFGKRPIRTAWFFVVFPALILNYLGQGARLLYAFDAGGAVFTETTENPFYSMVDGWLRYPLIALATFAAIVASQALISGAYSLTQQAVQLGYWPRVTIKHTSGRAEGQIYVPEINQALMVGCIALVLTRQKSTELAAAYGIAVTGTMSITSVLFYGVARKWGWSRALAGSVVLFFLVIDLAFFSANIHKIGEGGWLPLAIGLAIFVLMTTYNRGRAALYESIRAATLPMDVFLADCSMMKPYRVKGSAIFMTSNPDGAPPAMLHHFKHNKVLHEQVVLLAIQTRHIPEIPAANRIEKVVELGNGFYQVVAVYGFMQTPNVLEVLELCRSAGLDTNARDTSFFLGRETLVITDKSTGMAKWRKVLFAFMSRNARPANTFFQIPPNRVVELGTQIEL
ncbi:MAG: Kup system potassium uptake protein [Labilithrix sp.]|nr:Kup system potassium uptake protein [Labilithrix sp.]